MTRPRRRRCGKVQLAVGPEKHPRYLRLRHARRGTLEIIAHTEAASRLEHDYVLFDIGFDP